MSPINMHTALDVQYDDQNQRAIAAAVTFLDWMDAGPTAEYSIECRHIEPYVPGQFYKRELPCLLAVIRSIPEPLTTIIIDGYVNLGSKPGLGLHLWESLGHQTPIIGVAKTAYHSAIAAEIKRGESDSPLFITAVGVDLEQAAERVQRMAGTYRIPDLLRRVDQLARSAGFAS